MKVRQVMCRIGGIQRKDTSRQTQGNAGQHFRYSPEPMKHMLSSGYQEAHHYPH